MGTLKLKGKDLLKLGFPNNQSINIALEVMKRNFATKNIHHVKTLLKNILHEPQNFADDLTFGQIAEALLTSNKTEKRMLLQNRVPFQIFGNNISDETKNQLYTGLKLPISVQGALMPDAHLGYGLPIGGVLAVENVVIPYAVGMDIGCRMSLSILDTPISYLDGAKDKYEKALAEHTKFGMNEVHKTHIDNEIFERDTFDLIPILKRMKGKAHKQMGTSGGGNHFVEFGEVEITEEEAQIDLPKGKYLGILSHSGSRGFGAEIAQYYSRVAAEQCPLPKEAQNFAWLSLDSHLGLEYWTAMTLAGDYASACHDDIHRRLLKAVGGRVKARIENHHNFAWKEIHNGKEVIVHRKGATPANENELGIIPGSMTAKGFIVRGKGNPDSLHSASHGAGRQHSRGACKNLFTQNDIKKELKLKKITLLGGSTEEAPMAYKNINEVMNAQSESVDILGTFQPRIVRMKGK
ncbi:RtcB family protein [Frigoriflavimonas asaccharolytica]|uniref:3'-phosphate/5'-hydroxy nucleic acid ligase n=1 Tax=Frigoriflavimonas asaccharolytica TaxID=2735899 RepID=A0A8J8G731_9FLAO|nr:RtcB family protein [Frigoriflavimonas asaccharolytica]NRS92469.1 tRNA-splicing ligase RtcB [Frigoriflavimonas asaccharolytica]